MPKKIKQFKAHTELNPPTSPSTGSITCYHGESAWKGWKDPYMFMDIADCNGKVRLHLTQKETKKDFIKKVRKLRNALDEYLEFLENQA